MPVVFGSSTTATGHGTWTYPDVGLVIGLLIDVDSVGAPTSSWGGTISRYRDAGVWAPITEAGRMHSFPVWNDQEVTYDIGQGPVGVAWDLVGGTQLTITEILSESPPTGGGGGSAVTASLIYDWSGGVSVPSGTWTRLIPDISHLASHPSIISFGSSGSAVVHQHGVYQILGNGVFNMSAPPPNCLMRLTVNGTDYWDNATDAIDNGASLRPTIVLTWDLNSGDVIAFDGYQDSGSAVSVALQYSVTLSETLP